MAIQRVRNAIAAAWNALVGDSPGLADYAASTVRPHEVGSKLTRYPQHAKQELVLRFSKYVAVAQGMNATAVASAKLGVYRRKRSSRKSAWDTRPISRKELARQRARAGFWTRKAADLADDVEEIVDPLHPLVKILTEANPLMNGYGLLEQTQLGVGLTGDAFWHIVAGPDGEPLELWPLPPQFVRPIPSQSMVIEAYIYGRGTEVERELSAGEVIRFTQPNPRGDPYRGMGDVEKCIDDADLSVAFSQFRLNALDNGAQPGLIIIDKKGGIESREQLEHAVNRKFGGLAKVGRSMVLTGDVEIIPWNMNEKEVSFLSSDASVRETIANCHNIPVALLTLDSAALATAKVAIPQWQEMGRKPRCDRMADTINQRLCPLFGDDLYVCFEEVVDRDYDAAAVRVRTLYSGDDKSIITLNEARAELDYDALPGGDEIPEPRPEPSLLGPDRGGPPGGDDQGASDEAAEDEPADDGEEKALGFERWTPPAIHIHNGHTGHRAASVAPQTLSQATLICGGHEPLCNERYPKPMRKDAAVDFITLTERELEAIVRSWFDGLAPKLGAQMTPSGLPSDTVGGISESLRAAVTGPISRTFLRGWNFGVGELGSSAGAAQIMAVLTGPVQAYLREHEGKLVRTVTETVDTLIREGLADGVAAGESIPQLTTRLRASIGDMSGMAAERIARTETAAAFMSAREKAWMESGSVQGKRWQLAPDACSFCHAIAEEVDAVALGESFAPLGSSVTDSFGNTMKLDYRDIDGPPLHPNCRCSMVFVAKETT